MKSVAYRYFKNLFLPNKLSFLIFFVTSECNAACPFCLNRDFSSVKNGGEGFSPLELTKEEIKEFASHIKNLPHLLISGGEPFIREDLAEIVSSFYQRSDTRLVTVPTNGYYFETIESNVKKILMKCPGINLRIHLSVNGVGSIHDQTKRLPESFENLKKTYTRLIKLKDKYSNLIMASITVITKELKGHLSELVNFFEREMPFLDDYYITSIRKGRENKEIIYLSSLERNSWKDFEKKQKIKMRRKSFLHIYSSCVLKRADKVINDSFKNRTAILPCLAGMKFIVLKEDGTVFPCEIKANKDMGNIRNFQYDIKKLLMNSRAREVANEIKTRECYCDWGCAMNINLISRWRYCFKIFLDALRY